MSLRDTVTVIVHVNLELYPSSYQPIFNLEGAGVHECNRPTYPYLLTGDVGFRIAVWFSLYTNQAVYHFIQLKVHVLIDRT